MNIIKKINILNYQLLHLIFMVMVIFFSSCLQTPSGDKRTAKKTTATTTPSPKATVDPSDPTVIDGTNYFQNGAINYPTILTVPFNFVDTFNLRGKIIHDYLSIESNRKSILCMIVPFTSQNKLLVLSATPRYFQNFSKNTKEYYYQLQSIDAALNKSGCQKTGILDILSSLFPSHVYFYSFADICPSCTNAIVSTPIRLFNVSGTEATDLSIGHLKISLTVSASETNPQTSTCTSSSACKSLGFNCCIQGQCVNDRQLKSGVNQTSLEFLQAQQDILSNPGNIYNWTQFYYICTSNISPTPEPTATANAGVIANVALETLQELYECTTNLKDELSICSINYLEASEQISSATPTPFLTGPDDRNFQSTYMGSDSSLMPNHSIYEIRYAGDVLFRNNETFLTGFAIDNLGSSNSGNDTLTDAQKVFVTRPLPEGAEDDTLKIKYKIDGSCRPINTLLAKCDKYYIQAQNTGEVSDHNASVNKFLLPYYADTTKTLIVTVDGYSTIQGTQWNLVVGSEKYVEFVAVNPVTEVGMEIFDQQVVKITFYVNLQNYPILQKKKEALDQIDTICNCGGPNCSLAPVYTGTGLQRAVSNYICVYPTPVLPEPPLNQIITISSKTAPLRFYDSLGLSIDVPVQGKNIQEGNVFKYLEKGNPLKPNNILTDVSGELIDVGFNEIYGSFSLERGSALPANVTSVVYGRQYDIIVNAGIFSSCQSCGTDYYTLLNKVFPENFKFKGGGYMPDPKMSNRKGTNATGEGQYRADDLLFGRACFLPATMIPWTHQKSSDFASQRKNRLAAQHFLFANGYMRDWFGFDYGSVIGSFDGVAWFAVGNQRRIKAKSNKLFLAINAYHGDLTQENPYSITITESSPVIFSGSSITSDFDSDGAECQKFHVCTKDSDCITQLGWEYTCQQVNNIRTNWPHFNVNAREMPNTERSYRLVDIIGKSSGPPKRCVYRAKGVPCNIDFRLNANQQTFTSSNDQQGVHACMSSYYCQSFVDSNEEPVGKFNKRIGRFAKSPDAQNRSTEVEDLEETDTFGLGARFLGRPYSFNGSEEIDPTVRNQLSYNKVSSLCLPGRNPDNDSFVLQHSKDPTVAYNGDKILGIGMTPDDNTGTSHHLLSSCSILDGDGNYYFLDPNNSGQELDDPTLVNYAASQAYTTNLLDIFQNDPNNPINILTDSSSTLLDVETLQENRCLRAAGSPCFTSFDCAPSQYTKSKVVDMDEEFMATLLHEAEINFWKEELTCGQMESVDSPDFNLKSNRCCRETGKTLTIYTDKNDPAHPLNTSTVPGVGLLLSSPTRYSRVAPIYGDMQTSTNYKVLVSSQNDQCQLAGGCTNANTMSYQFLGFGKVAEKTCCSGNWVRSFNLDSNQGGHDWSNWGQNKRQSIDMSNFRCLGWTPSSDTDPTAVSDFSCVDPDTGCNAKSLSNSEITKYSRFLSSLELLGIPQVLIKTNFSNNFEALVESKRVGCITGYSTESRAAAYLPIPGTIRLSTTFTAAPLQSSTENDAADDPGTDFAEYSDSSLSYFSAIDAGNFSSDLKMVFSENEVNCCLPAGKIFNTTITDQQCCTGRKVANQNRCCLPSYANVTVYLNRYVSSEASNISEKLFDPLTGAPNSASLVQQVVADKNLCCSGRTALGAAVSNLMVPEAAADAQSRFRRRFIYRSEDANISHWTLGQRWNTDVYCIPSGN